MEAISIVTTAIIAAITAGVTGGVKDVGKQAVLDAYGALKDAIKTKFGKAGKSATAINELEESPDSKGWQMVLAEDMSKEKIHEDMEIVKIARDLIAALKESESGRKALDKYKVDARGASIGVMGDKTVISWRHSSSRGACIPKNRCFYPRGLGTLLPEKADRTVRQP